MAAALSAVEVFLECEAFSVAASEIWTSLEAQRPSYTAISSCATVVTVARVRASAK